MSKLNLKNLKNKNIHIVGIGGTEGSAIAEFLVANNISSITGHDFSLRRDFKEVFCKTHLSLKLGEREKALQHLLDLPIRINFKDHYLEGIKEADIIFVSQVWFKYSQNMPILQDLKNRGVLFKTITNLYFELAPCPIISVTGTNGKTTTVRLINSIFESWVGDDGIPPAPFLKGGASPLSPRERVGVRGVVIGISPFRKGGWGDWGKGDSITALINKISPKKKPKVYFAGNDRQNVQVLDRLNEMTKNDVLILETSSTQLLLSSGISPHIGVITNITPNHLDDHGSFENYIEAKKNLIRYQGRGDFAVLNYDDAESRKIINESRIKNYESRIFLFSRNITQKGSTVPSPRELWSQHSGCFVENGKIIIRGNSKDFRKKQKILKQVQNDTSIICNINDLKILGKHNLENVLAAVSVAYLYGVDLESIRKGVVEYTGTKHRLKLLYNIAGVKYYDDTQATTPEATIAGIESFDDDIILLAGGDNKKMDYKNLAEKINSKVKLLILFPGDASDKIEKLVDQNKINFIKVNNFAEAIAVLKSYYKKTALLNNKTTVLISPGAAHFYSRFVEESNKSLREWVRLVSN